MSGVEEVSPRNVTTSSWGPEEVNFGVWKNCWLYIASELDEGKPFKVNWVGVVWPSIAYVANEGLCESADGMKPYQLSWSPAIATIDLNALTKERIRTKEVNCHFRLPLRRHVGCVSPRLP